MFDRYFNVSKLDSMTFILFSLRSGEKISSKIFFLVSVLLYFVFFYLHFYVYIALVFIALVRLLISFFPLVYFMYLYGTPVKWMFHKPCNIFSLLLFGNGIPKTRSLLLKGGCVMFQLPFIEVLSHLS